MAEMVEIKNLSKFFGKMTAVKNLSFTVAPGTVAGFIGPNGAGKSTTLKILATILRPSTGSALVDGYSVGSDAQKVRRLIGYMPDVAGLYEDMLVHEYLRFFCSIYGIRGADAKKTVDDVLGLTGLTTKINEPCGALSRGMSQRLHLARVLLHDPKLLLLDEPASGLDPRARIEFKELILALRGMGKTMLISSHILSELGEMCDTLIVIEQSQLVYSGSVEGVGQGLDQEGRVYLLKILVEPDQGRSHGDFVELLRGFPYVNGVREGDREGEVAVRFESEFQDPYQLNSELVARGFKVAAFAPQVHKLEDAFLHITKGLVQ